MELHSFLHSSVTGDGIYKTWTQEILGWTEERIFQNKVYEGDTTDQWETNPYNLKQLVSLYLKDELLKYDLHGSATLPKNRFS